MALVTILALFTICQRVPMTSPIVVALDFPGFDQAMAMARQLDPQDCRVKVGKELFTRCGPRVVEALP